MIVLFRCLLDEVVDCVWVLIDEKNLEVGMKLFVEC